MRLKLGALAFLALLVACMAPAALADFEDYDCLEATRQLLLGMSDDALYNVGLDGIEDSSGTVNCRIADHIGKAGACDLYVKVYPPSSTGYDGWPLNRRGEGTGCVRAPDLPKRMTTCWYARDEYDLTSAERSSFCTDSGKTNAVAQLRHAISAGTCTFCKK